jgi:hypothetical protein
VSSPCFQNPCCTNTDACVSLCVCAWTYKSCSINMYTMHETNAWSMRHAFKALAPAFSRQCTWGTRTEIRTQSADYPGAHKETTVDTSNKMREWREGMCMVDAMNWHVKVRARADKHKVCMQTQADASQRTTDKSTSMLLLTHPVKPTYKHIQYGHAQDETNAHIVVAHTRAHLPFRQRPRHVRVRNGQLLVAANAARGDKDAASADQWGCELCWG